MAHYIFSAAAAAAVYLYALQLCNSSLTFKIHLKMTRWKNFGPCAIDLQTKNTHKCVQYRCLIEKSKKIKGQSQQHQSCEKKCWFWMKKKKKKCHPLSENETTIRMNEKKTMRRHSSIETQHTAYFYV